MTFFPNTYREAHSASGRTYILKHERRRWNVFIDDVHVVTFFTRENARKYIRAFKVPSLPLNYGSKPRISRPRQWLASVLAIASLPAMFLKARSWNISSFKIR